LAHCTNEIKPTDQRWSAGLFVHLLFENVQFFNRER
jgi:hypothetical protein